MVGWPQLAAKPSPKCSLPPSRIGKRIRSTKARKRTPSRVKIKTVYKLKGWVGEIKNLKWCKSNHSPLADRCPANLRAMATREKLPPRFITEHDITQYRVSLWSIHVSHLHCVPFPTPNLLTGAAEWESEKASTVCKHCSATAKTLVTYQQFWSPV